MHETLTFVWALIVAHQDGIINTLGTVAAATIVTACTKYPQGRGPLGVILRILDAIALARHKDSPDANIGLEGLLGRFAARLHAPGWLSPLPTVEPTTKEVLDGDIGAPKGTISGGSTGMPVWLPLLGLLTLTAQGCAPSLITTARKSVAIADQVQAQGVLAFELYDLHHQKQIVADAMRRDDGMVQILDYREKREKVVLAFFSLADTSHAAKVMIDAVDVGQKGKFDLAAILVALASAANALQTAASAIGYTVPGLSALAGGG